MSEPAKKPKKTPAPRKPRTKKTKLPEPFTADELTESYKSIPAADLEPIPDPFVPDEFGVIPPQTGDTGLTIKGVPLVFVPGKDIQSAPKKLVGLGWLAGSMDEMTREEHIAKLNDLATNGRLTEISSSPAPISSEDSENTRKDDNSGDQQPATQAISSPTSANFMGSLENTGEQQPGKTEEKDGSEDRLQRTPQATASRLEVPSTPQPATTDGFRQDNNTLDAGEHENAGLDAGTTGTTQVDSQATEKNQGDAVSSASSANFICPNRGQQCNGYGNGCKCSTPKDETTQPSTTDQGKNQGDVAIGPAVADSNSPANSLESVLPTARARDGETKGQCRERLRQEARTSGMTRRDAISYAGRMVEQVWFPPPPEPEPVIVEEPPAEPEEVECLPLVDKTPEVAEVVSAPPADLGVSGLGELPESWGNLPANAQLQVEIAWVSANRLRVRSGNGVDLSRALSPAPSYSALSWLETSILFPSKFADISVKATADQDDEREHIKREKLAIEEIRSILKEMLEG